MAASIVLLPPLKLIGSKSYSSPILSPGSWPPSVGPGCNALSPMFASFWLAYTWLLLRANTLPAALRTRAPMVPAVIAGWPVETPIGTGLGNREVGSLRAKNMPVTSTATGSPSSRSGNPSTPAHSVKIFITGRPASSKPMAVPTTPG